MQSEPEMKFDRKELLRRLSYLKPAISSTSSIAQLRHIWFEDTMAFAYNGGLGIKIDLETGFNFAVVGAPLIKLLGDDVGETVTLEAGKNVLVATLGRATVELPTMDPSMSPWTFPEEAKVKVELSLTPAVRKALKRVGLVRTNKPMRVEHHGVILFSVAPGELLLYTTDSRAMIETVLKIPKGKSGLNKIVLPFEFVEAIQSFEEGSLSICGDCLIAEAEGILVCSNMLDSSGVANLPKMLDDIMQDKTRSEMVALPEGLHSALNRAEVLSDGGDVQLKLLVDNSLLSLGGKLALGSFNETLPLEEGKSSIKAGIGIDGSILKRVLSEGKRFSIADNGRLVVEGEDDFLFIQAAYST